MELNVEKQDVIVYLWQVPFSLEVGWSKLHSLIITLPFSFPPST